MKHLLKSSLVLLCFLAKAHSLSWPLCADGGSVWVTERPQVGSTYPGANLWYFCDGALNILGDSVDPCIRNGTLCNSAVTDAICKFLGYDHAYQGATLRQAKPDEVVRSLTGEYCLQEGTYSTTLPADTELKALPGKPCMRVEQLTCIRTVEHMAGDLQNIVWELALNSSSAPHVEPAPSEVNVTLPVRAAEAAP